MIRTRVMLAEDHTLVRTGIRALLERIEGVEVVGEATNGRDALEMASRLRPDLILMDLTMPELNGFEATARIVKEVPECRVLVLSMHADEEYVGQALRAGAAGYLLKDSSNVELELALLAVRRGESYLSPGVSRRVVEEYVQSTGARPTYQDALTPRQREILQLIAEGNATKQIAAKLDVSVKTVETHRAQLMQRLDIHDVPGLVRYAIRTGLASLD